MAEQSRAGDPSYSHADLPRWIAHRLSRFGLNRSVPGDERDLTMFPTISSTFTTNGRRCLRTGLGLAAVLTTAAWPLTVQAQNRVHRQTRTASLSSGTVIPVKLDDELSSQNSHSGDTFSATVTDAESSYDGSSALPVGTKVEGVVRSAKAKQDKNPGMLDLAFTRVTLPSGRSYSISGTPIGLDSKSVVRKNGRIVAKAGSKGPNRLTYVGIGAGAGLLVNVLAHRKGTLTDVLIGAAAGYGAGSLIKGGSSSVRDVTLKSGTTMGVALTQSLALGR